MVGLPALAASETACITSMVLTHGRLSLVASNRESGSGLGSSPLGAVTRNVRAMPGRSPSSMATCATNSWVTRAPESAAVVRATRALSRSSQRTTGVFNTPTAGADGGERAAGLGELGRGQDRPEAARVCRAQCRLAPGRQRTVGGPRDAGLDRGTERCAEGRLSRDQVLHEGSVGHRGEVRVGVGQREDGMPAGPLTQLVGKRGNHRGDGVRGDLRGGAGVAAEDRWVDRPRDLRRRGGAHEPGQAAVRPHVGLPCRGARGWVGGAQGRVGVEGDGDDPGQRDRRVVHRAVPPDKRPHRRQDRSACCEDLHGNGNGAVRAAQCQGRGGQVQREAPGLAGREGNRHGSLGDLGSIGAARATRPGVDIAARHEGLAGLHHSDGGVDDRQARRGDDLPAHCGRLVRPDDRRRHRVHAQNRRPLAGLRGARGGGLRASWWPTWSRSWPLVAGALQPVKSMRTSPTATATAEARSVRSARYAGWLLECVIAVTR